MGWKVLTRNQNDKGQMGVVHSAFENLFDTDDPCKGNIVVVKEVEDNDYSLLFFDYDQANRICEILNANDSTSLRLQSNPQGWDVRFEDKGTLSVRDVPNGGWEVVEV